MAFDRNFVKAFSESVDLVGEKANDAEDYDCLSLLTL